MGIRKAAFSGQFYESDKDKLEKNITGLLRPGKNTKEEIIGLIVPHAGYFYSGKAAAAAYSILNKKFDTFVIIGPSHKGDNSVSFNDFETPLGVAENDIEFSKKLSKIIINNEDAHKYEHCIEVQLPFLQHLFKKIRIAPVLIGDLDYAKCKELAKQIFNTAKELKRKICLIISSDFTHYGAGYGFVPFSGNDKEIKKKIYGLDSTAISFIEKLNGKEFFDFSEKTTICGRLPITIGIEYAKLMKSKTKFIDYYTSGDIVNDYKNSVGYASISFVV